ncbi:glycosyl hydrolase family 47-domain-containing protein [Pestalotiopsis sp. NC0098]|nr:glycosyl hydrolase family 47-domain-containing protein [Pestalotiopsis sp. NC0098]
MLRVRRYRVYMILAAVGLLLLYRMTQDTDWEALSTRPIDYTSDAGSKAGVGSTLNTENDDLTGAHGIQRKRPQQKPLDGKEQGENIVKIPELKKPEEEDQKVDYTLPTSTSNESKAKPTEVDETEAGANKVESDAKTTDKPVIVIPDRKTPHQIWAEEAEKERQEQDLLEAPNKQGFETTTTTKSTSTSTIHWRKPTEVFPVAPESLLTLPTGKPRSIPKVQHMFNEEPEDVRLAREGRLAVVKGEMQRAWAGYRQYAWMHDELSPVSLKFRDPFCGWAATLVDALDTLWIMGMKEEFAEAVQAVGKIDFTTSPRTEIPVFETTIRYLGGLLGAYDVSGGKEGGYEILLEKAVELAEILMGVFDTPNRMPILYYNWKPAFTGKARRAGSSVSVAELGSLLMEFTRLAQVTGDNRYYDAVARITDAFEEWQLRPNGTDIPGIFPEHVDASGCNKTASQNALMKFTAEQEANVQSVMDTPDDYTGREYTHKSRMANKMNSVPDLALSDKADRLGAKPSSGPKKRTVDADVDSDEDLYDHPSTLRTGAVTETKKFTAPLILSAPDLYQQMTVDRVVAEPYTIPELADVCYPQGLTSGSWGRNTFGMGGSQDSTYEYFPKQFLLLGGLEPKYETMHLKVADAVKKWLLYRPMVPDNRDILFSAKVTTNPNSQKDPISEFEVTHLTCFLGGMFGMAGKVFEEPVDVEIAKKLTDGCVWAYETTASGIMPEGGTVVPCAEASDCKWNETLWHQYLDPMWDMREKQIDDYYKRKALAKEKAEKERLEELRREAESELDDVSDTDTKVTSETFDIADLAEIADEMSTKSDAMADDKFITRKKRDLDTKSDKLETSSNDNTPPAKPSQKLAFEDPLDDILVAGGSGRVGKPVRGGVTPTPIQDDEQEDRTKPDPSRPLTHEEYIEARLKNEKIPPGFVTVSAKHYILRPEAIESVWYMYRITGDTTWQDKGWRMFESIIAATQTESGHSAISNVLVQGSDKDDAMESFWFAETLKYFYLLYATPDVINLDEWVLNTEAHPFKRPLPT